MGFNWILVGFVVGLVCVVATLVHGTASVIGRRLDRTTLEGCPYLALGTGVFLLVVQLLAPIGLPGRLGELAQPTPVYVGFALLLTGVGGVSTKSHRNDWSPTPVGAVATPVLAVAVLYPLAPVVGTATGVPSAVGFQWRGFDQVTVSATLLLVFGAFYPAGYLSRGQLRAVGTAVGPPLIAIGVRLATQSALGTGIDSGVAALGYVYYAPAFLIVGVWLSLVGQSISDRDGRPKSRWTTTPSRAD